LNRWLVEAEYRGLGADRVSRFRRLGVPGGICILLVGIDWIGILSDPQLARVVISQPYQPTWLRLRHSLSVVARRGDDKEKSSPFRT
jgi:hypothetical protein